MIRLLVAFALMTGMAPIGVASQNPPGEPPTTHLLHLEAIALDRDGAPVQDLKAEDIEVWIAGYRVPIEALITVLPGDERSGRSIVLLFDDMTVPPAMLPRLREAARRFVNRMAPGDQMAVVMLSGDSMEIASDPAPLLRRIAAYNTRATGVMRIDDLSAHVLTTITSVSRQLAEAPGRRKTIVALGPAWLFDTPMPPPSAGRDVHPEWVEAMRALAFAHASLYVIDPGGVGTAPATGGSSGFARDTGGHTFVNTNDLNAAADRILREASTYYVIRVADPPAHRKAPLREVEVRVLRPGITVRARKGIPGTR